MPRGRCVPGSRCEPATTQAASPRCSAVTSGDADDAKLAVAMRSREERGVTRGAVVRPGLALCDVSLAETAPECPVMLAGNGASEFAALVGREFVQASPRIAEGIRAACGIEAAFEVCPDSEV